MADCKAQLDSSLLNPSRKRARESEYLEDESDATPDLKDCFAQIQEQVTAALEKKLHRNPEVKWTTDGCCAWCISNGNAIEWSLTLLEHCLAAIDKSVPLYNVVIDLAKSAVRFDLKPPDLAQWIRLELEYGAVQRKPIRHLKNVLERLDTISLPDFQAMSDISTLIYKWNGSATPCNVQVKCEKAADGNILACEGLPEISINQLRALVRFSPAVIHDISVSMKTKIVSVHCNPTKQVDEVWCTAGLYKLPFERFDATVGVNRLKSRKITVVQDEKLIV